VDDADEDEVSDAEDEDGIRPTKRSQKPRSDAPPAARCRASRSASRLFTSSIVAGSLAMKRLY
jgi:hypothetical protein